jgi:ribonuclease HI
LASERRVARAGLSREAKRALEGLLEGRSLDDVAPRGSAVRAEVEAHIVASLEWATRGRKAAKASTEVEAGPPAGPARAAGGDRAVAYSDGASRGNPGPAAIGIRILGADGTELWSEGRAIGRATNNVAEYRGAIAALEKARELGLRELELRMDSELVVRQLQGSYRVKEPSLLSLKKDLDRLMAGFRSVRVRHVRRGENLETDRLANEALDGERA